MQIFKEKIQKGFKSRFDTAIAKYSSRAAGIFRNFGKRFDLRRVMVILLQQKNFSTNVIYFVVGHEGEQMVCSKLMIQKKIVIPVWT